MSVIVMGMYYPTCCDECDEGLDCSGDYPMCRYTGEQRGYNFNIRARKMDKCPLRPLPEKHGRLGDLDAIMNKLAEDKRETFTKHDVWLMLSRYGAETIVEAEGE